MNERPATPLVTPPIPDGLYDIRTDQSVPVVLIVTDKGETTNERLDSDDAKVSD